MESIKGKKVLVTDKVSDLLIKNLEEVGFEVNYIPKMSYDSVQKAVGDYQGLIINSKVICDKIFLKKASHLDFIGRLGSGLDIIDLPFAKEIGVEIISSPEGNANAVAEHAMGMILSLLNNICRSGAQFKKSLWEREPNRGRTLEGMTVGIIGFGHTGPALAEKLKNWNVTLLVYDKYRKGIEETFPYVLCVDQDVLITESDIVSIHLPLTQETENLVNESFLRSMRQGSILVNTSRGRIAKSEAILSAIEDEHLSGACLDVLENEKPETWTDEERKIYEGFQRSDQVVITPHIAGWTFKSLDLIASILSQKILNFYQI